MNAAPDPIRAYRDWIVTEALPFWSSAGFDAGAGRFHERLDRTGAPLDVPHRSMVQARQIYVFAHAAERGWLPEGAALAETAMASLLRDFYAEEDGKGSFAFSIAPGGGIVSSVRDAYAHAFALFALAWTYRLNGDAGLLTIADRTIAFIDGALEDAMHGGLFDAAPIADRCKRQNPLMHLLEAYLFLEQAAPGRGYLARAGRIVALFEQRLFVSPPGVLLEYFAEDWGAPADPPKADIWEPGHHFEWVWLLDRYAALAGTNTRAWADTLYDVATARGIADSGLIYDEVGADLKVRKANHRLWPHTEAIKAAVVRHARGDAGARSFADDMARALLKNFCGRPFAGGWIDQIDPDGLPLVDYVPASSLYHLFLAAAEADATFGAVKSAAVAAMA